MRQHGRRSARAAASPSAPSSPAADLASPAASSAGSHLAGSPLQHAVLPSPAAVMPPGNAADAACPPPLRPFLKRMRAFAAMWQHASPEQRQIWYGEGMRALNHQGSKFSMSRAMLPASVELARHLLRLPRTMDKGLLHPELEDRLAAWILATFQGSAHDVLQNKLEVAERTPSTGDRVGMHSVLFRALCALNTYYSRAHAAAEMRTLVASFHWAANVAETHEEFDTLWSQAEVVADQTAGLTALNSFPAPTWADWLRTVLLPALPRWAAVLASDKPVEFATADEAWACLHQHEPQAASNLNSLHAAVDTYADFETYLAQHNPSTGLPWPDGRPRVMALASSLMALAARGECWRCASPYHQLWDCKSDKSPAERQRLPRPWPVMPRNRAQQLAEEPPRPATAPTLYERPGPYGPASGRDAYVTSVQAMPAVSDETAARLELARQMESLQAAQDSQTQVLQQLSTLLVSQMPASVAVPYPHVSDSGTIHQLASSLPPVRFGSAPPGANYVAIPAGTVTWLRTDVAEASMTTPTAAPAPADV